MTDRDELESVLVNVLSNAMNYPDPVVMLGKDTGPLREKVADAVLAARYRKVRTITTAEELDALPEGSIIRTDNTFALEKVPDEFGTPWMWGHKLLSNRSVQLPALVLYVPEEQS